MRFLLSPDYLPCIVARLSDKIDVGSYRILYGFECQHNDILFGKCVSAVFEDTMFGSLAVDFGNIKLACARRYGRRLQIDLAKISIEADVLDTVGEINVPTSSFDPFYLFTGDILKVETVTVASNSPLLTGKHYEIASGLLPTEGCLCEIFLQPLLRLYDGIYVTSAAAQTAIRVSMSETTGTYNLLDRYSLEKIGETTLIRGRKEAP